MSIVVFGSINMDLVARAPRLPEPGETLTGHTFSTVPGGKGANQAVACARLGAPTSMVGRVGDDVFGHALLQSLEGEGISTQHVRVDRGVSSGVALIAVDDTAENSIIVIPGANGRVGEEDLASLADLLAGAGLLLLQLEIPMEMVVAGARLAQQHGVTVILDPAPARELPQELYTLIDILTPNEAEAAALAGFQVKDQDDAARAARVLVGQGVERAVIKMGAQGAYAASGDGGRFHPAIPVHAVDTVAAGDAFNGALAVALSEGKSLEEAMQWAVAAGALAVTKEGAQPAMPRRADVVTLLSWT